MTNDQMTEGHELIKRQTVASMCDAWKKAKAQIEEAFSLIRTAEATLTEAFPTDYGFKVEAGSGYHTRCPDWEKPEETMQYLKIQAWRVIITRIELRRVLSVARCAELDKSLETGKDLPDIEETQIWAMLEGTLAQVNQFIEEAVKEVFDFLRPWNTSYKTNQSIGQELGNKVILSWAVRAGYGRTYDVQYGGSADKLRALDNVMMNLDGKGTVKSNRGPLVDAICSTPHEIGKGETEYFKFKCFQNGNLHLEFKRPDLLAKINAICGGLALKGAKAA